MRHEGHGMMKQKTTKLGGFIAKSRLDALTDASSPSR
jgi:hypothetical protein